VIPGIGTVLSSIIKPRVLIVIVIECYLCVLRVCIHAFLNIMWFRKMCDWSTFSSFLEQLSIFIYLSLCNSQTRYLFFYKSFAFNFAQIAVSLLTLYIIIAWRRHHYEQSERLHYCCSVWLSFTISSWRLVATVCAMVE
jgi:hypothetical protein